MTISHKSARVLHRSGLLQVAVMLGFWLLGEAVVRLTGLPVPGSVVGLALVLVLLATRRLSPFSVRRGANYFLADMLLFFVPAVLAVLNHPEFLGLMGVKILFVILASTASVMVVTAFVIDRCSRWRSPALAPAPVAVVEAVRHGR